MANKRIPLEPDKYYHVYNHGNSSDNIFRCEDNYKHFLKKYGEHIFPIAETYAYCLMPNHFHFLIRIKDEKQLAALNPQGFENLVGFISQQFSNFFNAYAKAFNKMYGRKGSLFLDNFERIHISSDAYFKKLIHYIHYNPVHHGFTTDLRDWKYSSYESFFSKTASRLKRELVIKWFDDIDNFIAFHQKDIDTNLPFEME
jgi:REP element-mobilizing transposase RayT